MLMSKRLEFLPVPREFDLQRAQLCGFYGYVVYPSGQKKIGPLKSLKLMYYDDTDMRSI